MADEAIDFISDDSDFYGDEKSCRRLNLRREELESSAYWSYHDRLPAVLTGHSVAADVAPTASTKISSYNPFEGQVACARQLDESTSAFVDRLPPSRTHKDAAGPWIWIADPHQKHKYLDHDYSRLREDGEKLLDDYNQYKKQTEKRMQGKAVSTIIQRLRPAQNQLLKDIRSLAQDCNVKAGKWMLFPQTDILDSTWRTTCESIVAGKLGSTAKVATAGAERGEGGVRLICVYTEDFADEKDVRRVLDQLFRLGLVGDTEGGRGIWYKMDAYTHLGIESGNEYGLKASLYGSRALLAAS